MASLPDLQHLSFILFFVSNFSLQNFKLSEMVFVLYNWIVTLIVSNVITYEIVSFGDVGDLS